MRRFALMMALVPASPLLVSTAAHSQLQDRCAVLYERLERQDLIDGAFECDMLEPTRAIRETDETSGRCSRFERIRLSRLWNRRANLLERCLETKARAAARELPTNERESPAAAGLATAPAARTSANTTPAGRESTGAVTREPVPATPGREERRKGTADLVRELLSSDPVAAAGQRLPPGSVRSVSRSRPFRAGLTWSYAGRIEGMHCVQWNEPSDPNNWYDNYLCSERDIGFQWSYRGPILGRGLKCIQVKEPSDPHDWHDNYFCWPRNLDVEFRFSHTGRVPEYDCLAVVEPSDPYTWQDNFLCHRPTAADRSVASPG